MDKNIFHNFRNLMFLNLAVLLVILSDLCHLKVSHESAVIKGKYKSNSLWYVRKKSVLSWSWARDCTFYQNMYKANCWFVGYIVSGMPGIKTYFIVRKYKCIVHEMDACISQQNAMSTFSQIVTSLFNLCTCQDLIAFDHIQVTIHFFVIS